METVDAELIVPDLLSCLTNSSHLKFQFCGYIYYKFDLQDWSLKFMSGQNKKIKYLMCQVPTKIFKRHVKPNSRLQNLNICFSKLWKNQPRWIYVKAILKLRNINRRDIISDFHFLLPILNAFTVGTEHYNQRCL